MIDNYIKEISRKHAEKIEEITREQFEVCLLEAIKSGDFMRHIKNGHMHLDKNGNLTDNSRYGMTYVPFREKLRLELKIQELYEQIVELSDKLNA